MAILSSSFCGRLNSFPLKCPSPRTPDHLMISRCPVVDDPVKLVGASSRSGLAALLAPPLDQVSELRFNQHP